MDNKELTVFSHSTGLKKESFLNVFMIFFIKGVLLIHKLLPIFGFICLFPFFSIM